MDKKPNVFPESPSPESLKPVPPAEREEKLDAIYSNVADEKQLSAVEQMRERTKEQLRLRDEALRNNKNQIKAFQEKTEVATNRHLITAPLAVEPVTSTPVQLKQQPTMTPAPQVDMSAYVDSISQPQFNAAFDLIPLPSEGKVYKGKRPNVKVGFLTTADENILTSPNLLASGQFLEILINRKLLEQDIRFRDLHIGDRNAIMIWLRATSYGEMYPVTLLDEKEEPFQTEINLNDLKVKKLGAEPDAEGLFDFSFKLCKKTIKFKLLTVGDVDEIDMQLEVDRVNAIPINYENTYILSKQIVEVDGQRGKEYIRDFVDTLRAGDASDFRTYVNDIESGVDLNITVGTPGGGSIDTFLPLNLNFFWPKLRV